MRTWLFEGVSSVVLFALLAVVLLGPFLAVVYRRFRWPAPVPTALAVASALYACALVAFTTFPLPRDPGQVCRTHRGGRWQLDPFVSFAALARRAGDESLWQVLTSTAFLQVAFNVVFFVPLGFLVAYVARRGLGTAAVTGLSVSLLIETTQGTALWGLYPCPYRLADVDDLMTNTAGALVGWCAGAAVRRKAPFVPPPARSDLRPPTARRRLAAGVIDVTVLGFVNAVIGVVGALLAASHGVPGDSYDTGAQALSTVLGIVWMLGLPLVRRDRATPGEVAVLLGSQPLGRRRRAPVWSTLVRFAVRWLPIVLWGAPAALVVMVVELVTIRVRADDRSLAAVLSHTVTRTHDSIVADAGGIALDRPTGPEAMPSPR